MPLTPADPAPEPSPERENSNRKQNVWVQVARYSQLALVLPSATVVGWLLGAALDRWLHTRWISILGLLLGTSGGLIEVIRTILRDTK
jgi:F0F1-type ATP synthase assembly protein I